MFQYYSKQLHFTMKKGKKKVKTNIVSIRNGKGVKTVLLNEGGKTRKSTHKLSKKEIAQIQKNRFIPGLFVPCENCLKAPMRQGRQTRKRR